MNRKIGVHILCLLFVLFLTSCGVSKRDQLVGKWELQEKEWQEILELYEDGSYRINTSSGWNTGEWRLVDDEHMALGKHINDFSFDQGDLILVDVKGEKYRYVRK